MVGHSYAALEWKHIIQARVYRAVLGPSSVQRWVLVGWRNGLDTAQEGNDSQWRDQGVFEDLSLSNAPWESRVIHLVVDGNLCSMLTWAVSISIANQYPALYWGGARTLRPLSMDDSVGEGSAHMRAFSSIRGRDDLHIFSHGSLPENKSPYTPGLFNKNHPEQWKNLPFAQ